MTTSQHIKILRKKRKGIAARIDDARERLDAYKATEKDLKRRIKRLKNDKGTV